MFDKDKRKVPRQSLNEKINYVKSFGCELLEDSNFFNSEKVSIKCGCGNVYIVGYTTFKAGQKTCKSCSTERIKKEFTLKYDDVKNYIEENTDMRLLSESYIDNVTPLRLMCECGNECMLSFSRIKNKSGSVKRCQKCGYKKTSKMRKESLKYTIDDVRAFTKDNSDSELLSTEYIHCNRLLSFSCRCGKEYKSTWSRFKREEHRRMCKDCSNSMTKGEEKVAKTLDYLNIEYTDQKTFDDLVGLGGRKLLFDFYFKYNGDDYIIEYDGKQHFVPIKFFGGEEKFKKQKLHDEMKNDFCKKNNINILRIPYYQESMIKEILENKIELLVMKGKVINMNFSFATCEFWISKGYDVTHWRKSIDGTMALCHDRYAMILVEDILVDENVTTLSVGSEAFNTMMLENFTAPAEELPPEEETII